MSSNMVRYREGPVPREVHLMTPRQDSPTQVEVLCGQWVWRSQAEFPDSLGDRPCVACQLLSPEPDWPLLRSLPSGRHGFSNSGL